MLTVAVSFVTAILAGMGVGSGGLMVVFLTLVSSVPQHDAQLLNLIFFVSSSVAAFIINLRKKRLSPPLVISITLPGCLFAIGASLIARQIESNALKKAFGLFMILLGALSLVSSLKSAKKYKK